jgi:hypothetical protein
MLSLVNFASAVGIMVQSLPGVGIHFGMNLGLYAGLTGLMKSNLHNCFLSFPIAGQGSANTLKEQNEIFQSELDNLEGADGAVVARMKEVGLKSDLKGYHQTVRLITSFCDLQPRECWVECLCCDGIGPNQDNSDCIFPGQALFWLFPLTPRQDKIHEMKFVARRKQWGSQLWTDVEVFV